MSARRPSTLASKRWAASLWVTMTASRFSSTTLSQKDEILSGSCVGLCGGGIGRFVVEQFGELGVLDDDGRIVLNGVKIFFLKIVAGFGGNKHFAGEGKRHFSVLRSDGLFGGEGFINAHDKFRNVVEPGELRVVHNEAEQFAGVDVAVLALVGAALHFEQRFVHAQKRQPQSDELFARGGVVVGAFQFGVRGVHVGVQVLFSARRGHFQSKCVWWRAENREQRTENREQTITSVVVALLAHG